MSLSQDKEIALEMNWYLKKMPLSKRNAFTAGKDCISVKFVLLCTVYTTEIQEHLYKYTSQSKFSFKCNVWFVKKKPQLIIKRQGKVFHTEVEMNPQKHFLWKQGSTIAG